MTLILCLAFFRRRRAGGMRPALQCRPLPRAARPGHMREEESACRTGAARPVEACCAMARPPTRRGWPIRASTSARSAIARPARSDAVAARPAQPLRRLAWSPTNCASPCSRAIIIMSAMAPTRRSTGWSDTCCAKARRCGSIRRRSTSRRSNRSATWSACPPLLDPGRPEYRLPLRLPAKVRRDLEAFAPDVVHVASPDIVAHRAISWARARHSRRRLGPHALRYLSWLLPSRMARPVVRAILRRFYRRCDALIVPAESTAAILRAQRMNRDISIWTRGIDRLRSSIPAGAAPFRRAVMASPNTTWWSPSSAGWCSKKASTCLPTRSTRGQRRLRRQGQGAGDRRRPGARLVRKSCPTPSSPAN